MGVILRTLGGRIWLYCVVLTLCVLVVGFFLNVETVPLGAITLFLMAGGFFIAESTSAYMRRFRREIEEFVATPSTVVPPSIPREVQPLLKIIIDLDQELRKTLILLDDSVGEEQKWTEAFAAASVALQSDDKMVGRMNALVPVLLRHCHMDVGGYFARLAPDEEPERMAWVGPGPTLPRGALSPRLEKELASGRVVWVDNLQPGSLPPSLHAYANSHSFECAIVSPAVMEGQLLGFLVLLGKTSRARNTRVVSFLESLRTPIAVAQQNSMSLLVALREERSTRIINELLLAVGRSVGRREASRRVLECVAELQPFDRGAMLSLAGDEYFEVFDPVTTTEGGPFLGTRLRRDGTCASSAMVSRSIRVDDDIRKQPPSEEDPVLLEAGFVSRLVVPLVVGLRSIGCLYLVSRKPAAFNRKHAETLRVVLQGVASSLDASVAVTDGLHAGATSELQQIETAKGVVFEMRTQVTELVARVATVIERDCETLPPRVVMELGDFAERSRQMLEMLEETCGRLGIELGERDLHLDEFFAADALKDATARVREKLATSRVRLEVEIPPSMPLIIADNGGFRNMVTFILEASAEVSPGDQEVRVRLSRVPVSELSPSLKANVAPTVTTSKAADTAVLVLEITDAGPTHDPAILVPCSRPGRGGGTVPVTPHPLQRALRIAQKHGGVLQLERAGEAGGNRVLVVLPQAQARRIGFVNYLGRRLKIARRGLSYLSLVCTGFKDGPALREKLGEETYASALQQLEDLCMQAVRGPIDAVQRFDGADLVVIFADTDRNGARSIANRVRSKVKAFKLDEQDVHPDIEVNVLTYPEDVFRGEDVLKKLETGRTA